MPVFIDPSGGMIPSVIAGYGDLGFAILGGKLDGIPYGKLTIQVVSEGEVGRAIPPDEAREDAVDIVFLNPESLAVFSGALGKLARMMDGTLSPDDPDLYAEGGGK